MKVSLKFEELFMFLLGIFLFSQLNLPWWWFLMLILTPDIGMLGYLVNSKTGAVVYNIFHHKGIAIILYLIGVFIEKESIVLAGVIIFSHAALDRFLGYGLKYPDSFHNTHLGTIGNKK